MHWQGQLSPDQTRVRCTIKLFGWTRLSAAWTAPDGVRFRVRTSGRVVLEVRGDGTDSDRDSTWLSAGTYRLVVDEPSASAATFDVRLSWQRGHGGDN